MIQALAIAIALLLGALGYQTVRLADERAAHAQTRERCANDRTKAADILAAKTTAARRTEQGLQTDANQARKATDEANSESIRLRDALRAERLRAPAAKHGTAPTVPGAASTAGVAGVAAGGDPAELSGAAAAEEEDEALRADVIRKELLHCYARYGGARRAASNL